VAADSEGSSDSDSDRTWGDGGKVGADGVVHVKLLGSSGSSSSGSFSGELDSE
jgi:hypothetical protein